MRKNNQKKIKIVVTGGAGFIGSWVVDYLLKDKKTNIGKIVLIDNLIRGSRSNISHLANNKRVQFVKKDIRDPKVLNRYFKGADWVVHMAVIKNRRCEDDPRLCNEILVDGTFNVFEACVKQKVKKMVFNSSASVYGEPIKLPMKENHPFNNDAFYGAGKIANEQFAKAFRKRFGLNYVCFRPFNVFGPRTDSSGIYTEVLIRWMERISEGLPPIIFGDGKQTFDFVYVEDVAKVIVKALKSNVNEGFYNLGAGKEVSLRQLAESLLKACKSDLKVEFKKGEGMLGFVSRRQADISKVKKDLGFKPSVTLYGGLVKFVKWYRGLKKNDTNYKTGL